MNSRNPAWIVVIFILGLFAFALTGLISEANLRTGTTADTPAEAIGKCLSVVRQPGITHPPEQDVGSSSELILSGDR
ncbi:hypothetical protein OKA04_07290 [Luteolibacter flavescens]|uniref:Uncharacterized protein n=1 Tax=Luteolibacter flavescens TaxID=1859460 RepID=A0ABT3FLS6_9BACT|nr:hypothetical protein [Luteolibacter flavescens]MCW1884531.1 hypothetical protein [Luteolibacter flavescens]